MSCAVIESTTSSVFFLRSRALRSDARIPVTTIAVLFDVELSLVSGPLEAEASVDGCLAEFAWLSVAATADVPLPAAKNANQDALVITTLPRKRRAPFLRAFTIFLSPEFSLSLFGKDLPGHVEPADEFHPTN